MRFCLYLLILLLGSSCSIIRNNKNQQVVSNYSGSNFFIESAYTSFYNDSLRISIDLYAEFLPSSNSNVIAKSVFNTNKKLINKSFGLNISPENFVFQIHGRHRDVSTSLYYIPDNKNLQDSVIYLQHKDRHYALHSIIGERGSYLQLLSVHNSHFEGLFTDEIFRDECSSIMSKFCYKNYYKAAKWHNDGMSIYLYDSDYLKNPLNQSVFADTTNITFPRQKIIGIANNRSDYSVYFKLIGPVEDLVNNQVIYINIYSRDNLIINGMEASPILTERVLSPNFFMKLKVNHNDYILTLSNDSGDIYALLGLHIW